ncbi:MAG: nitroreductase family protein [Snodgrassella sp.]|nr:nitroreductase family protein [Snodgrassella sp.]
MNIVDIAKQRYTTKHYDQSKKISTEQLEQLLEVIRNSPTSVNSQPGHFFIVDNDQARSKIMTTGTIAGGNQKQSNFCKFPARSFFYRG